MKKFLTSRIFVAIITGIIVGSIGVYAGSQILASNITYKDTTVDRALDDLYDKANRDLSITINSENYSSEKAGVSLPIGQFKSKYSYMKLSNLNTYTSSSCEIAYYKNGQSYDTNITTSQQYSLSMLDYFYIKSVGGPCGITVTFSNTLE